MIDTKNEELNQKADGGKNYKGAIPIVKEYETIIKTQNKNILNVT